MHRLILFLMIGSLFSCSSASSKKVIGPNSREAYFVKCAPLALDDCYEEAIRLCPTGYNFLDKNNNSSSVTMPMGGMFFTSSGPNTILIDCKY